MWLLGKQAMDTHHMYNICRFFFLDVFIEIFHLSSETYLHNIGFSFNHSEVTPTLHHSVIVEALSVSSLRKNFVK